MDQKNENLEDKDLMCFKAQFYGKHEKEFTGCTSHSKDTKIQPCLTITISFSGRRPQAFTVCKKQLHLKKQLRPTKVFITGGTVIKGTELPSTLQVVPSTAEDDRSAESKQTFCDLFSL